MSGSCHLDGVWNVQIGVESQIFVSFLFTVSKFFNSGHIKGVLTHKRLFLLICTVESQFKKALFKKEFQFKNDCWYNRFLVHKLFDLRKIF